MRNWLPLSLLALVLFSVMTTTLARTIKGGLPAHFVLFVVGVGFVTAYGVATVVSPPHAHALTTKAWIGLIVATVCSIIANFVFYKATEFAPNPALAVTVGGSQAIGVAIIGYVVFRDSLSAIQIAGIALAVVGMACVTLGHSS